MKRILALTAACALLASSALGQTDGLPEGAMKPATLNELGAGLAGRARDLVVEDLAAVGIGGEETPEGLSLFESVTGEDPHILEIKQIARELETQRAVMIQISALQRDLIDFAEADPVAAHQSRIPSHICEYALEERFCDAMRASFRKRKDIVISE